MGNMDLALIVLLTGLVVVFGVLIVLTFIIKGYGWIVTSITAANNKKKAAAQAAKKNEQSEKKSAAAPAAVKSQTSAAPAAQDGIPGEVIAAIAAAVDYTYGAGKYAVRKVRRVPQNRSAWANAGLAESTRPF